MTWLIFDWGRLEVYFPPGLPPFGWTGASQASLHFWTSRRVPDSRAELRWQPSLPFSGLRFHNLLRRGGHPLASMCPQCTRGLGNPDWRVERSLSGRPILRARTLPFGLIPPRGPLLPQRSFSRSLGIPAWWPFLPSSGSISVPPFSTRLVALPASAESSAGRVVSLSARVTLGCAPFLSGASFLALSTSSVSGNPHFSNARAPATTGTSRPTLYSASPVSL